MPEELSRRDFALRTCAALLGAGGLSSCAAVDQMARSGSVGGKEALGIDAHAHIFNGEDLDSFGYLFQELKPGSVEDVLLSPLTLLGHTITVLAKWAGPGMKLELQLLDNLLDRRHERIKTECGRKLLATSSVGARNAHADLLEKDIREIAWAGTIGKRTQGDLEAEMRGRFRAAMRNLGVDSTKKGISADFGVGHAKYDDYKHHRHPLAWLQTHLSLEDWLAGFISSMCNFRMYNAVNLMRRYPNVQAFVAASLDFDQWFTRLHHGNLNNPSEPIAEQALAMGKISVLSEGRILPRTGWCPLRQSVWDSPLISKVLRGVDDSAKGFDPLKVLKIACEQYGSVGAKLYPVLGYRASNNAAIRDEDFKPMNRIGKSGVGLGLGPRLDVALNRFYEMCDKEGYSITAHTNFSHGGGNREMERANPEHWKAVLRNHKNLAVNLGHFGGFDEGEHGNKRAGYANWPLTITEMMSEENRLYADLSFVSSKNIADRRKAFEAVLKGRSVAGSRLMYGTDWHELLSSLESVRYAKNWGEFFKQGGVKGLTESDFFAKNAIRCLGLNKGAKTRERLKTFYHKHQVSPAWVPMVDALQC